MSKKEKKEAIFSLGTQAYRKLLEDEEEFYICPICGHGFDRNALDQNYLTLEHVPPDSVGGEELLLTCKNCNNEAGAIVDSQVARRMEHFDFYDALYSKHSDYDGPAILEINNKSINIKLNIKSNGSGINMFGSGNDPNELRQFFENMDKKVIEGTWDKTKMNIKLKRGYNKWLSKVGDLRTGYLIAFCIFGYKYIFSKMLERVREQILNPKKKVLTNFWLPLGRKYYQKNVFSLVDEPFRAVFIGLGHTGVILPRLNSPDNLYSDTLSGIEEGAKIRLNGTLLKWPHEMHLLLDFGSIII